jgi:hypothetical protein
LYDPKSKKVVFNKYVKFDESRTRSMHWEGITSLIKPTNNFTSLNLKKIIKMKLIIELKLMRLEKEMKKALDGLK